MRNLVEHWMDERIRLHKPINLQGNLIRISAIDLLKLNQYRNELLEEERSLVEASEASKVKQVNYLY